MLNYTHNSVPMTELTDAEIATIQGGQSGMTIAPGGCYPQAEPKMSQYFPSVPSFSDLYKQWEVSVNPTPKRDWEVKPL